MRYAETVDDHSHTQRLEDCLEPAANALPNQHDSLGHLIV